MILTPGAAHSKPVNLHRKRFMFRETPHVPTFGSVITGHALTSIPVGIVLVLGLWLASLAPLFDAVSLPDLLTIGVIATIIMWLVQVVVFRSVSWSRQHYQPGSWILVLDHVITPVISTGVVAAVGLGSTVQGLAAGLVALATVVPLLLYMNQPWKDGITREETFQKVEQNHVMTREVARGEHDPEWLRRLQKRS